MKAIPVDTKPRLGAVYSPVGVMVPIVAGATHHVTLEAFPVKVNCFCCSGPSVIMLGWILAAKAGKIKENVDNKSNSGFLCMAFSTTKPKVVLSPVYDHHEFTLIGTQVYT